MFRRLSEPLPLSEASILAFRPALNAPVLNVKFMPVGPARAAIVVFGEEYGGIGVAIGIRSNESGRVVVFRNQEPIEPEVPVAEALESALGSAERMGFLFDEDMIESIPGGQGRSQAMALWGRLMGELEVPAPPVVIESQPATSESILESVEGPPAGSEPTTAGAPASMPELILDDVAQPAAPEISLDLEAAAEQAPLPAAAQTSASVEEETPPAPSQKAAMPATQALSKFRSDPERAASSAEADGDSNAETNGGSALGRIPLVRVRRGRPKQVPYLARLLSMF